MAQIGITKINDGARNAVFHVIIEGDGTGDLTDETLIDPATSFSPAMPAAPSMTIEKLLYDFGSFTAKLEFDYLASDIPIWTIAGDQSNCFDFTSFGGLKDRSPVLDGSGKLMLSTSGLAAGEKGSLIVWVRKD